MAMIHKTAIIDEGAEIGENVAIGPYCVVGKDVVLKNNVTLQSHVVLGGRTTIGEGTMIYPFASLGLRPQDLKFKGEPSVLRIGKNNVIREYVTMNPGTEGGGMITEVGDHCLFMMSTHVAHDCKIGNHVILANNATLAGHVTVGDHVVIGGLSAVHQFVRIGAHAMIGGMSGVENDVIPYGSVMGERAKLAGLNLIGMKRRGFSKDDMNGVRNAFKSLFFGAGLFEDRLTKTRAEFSDNATVSDILSFIEAPSDRPLCHPAKDWHDE